MSKKRNPTLNYSYNNTNMKEKIDTEPINEHDLTKFEVREWLSWQQTPQSRTRPTAHDGNAWKETYASPQETDPWKLGSTSWQSAKFNTSRCLSTVLSRRSSTIRIAINHPCEPRMAIFWVSLGMEGHPWLVRAPRPCAVCQVLDCGVRCQEDHSHTLISSDHAPLAYG